MNGDVSHVKQNFTMITAPPAIITRAVWETCPSPLRAMQVYSPISSCRIVEIRNSVPSLKMPTVGEGSTGLASLYHRISGVGVPSAWQFSIIESPVKKIENNNKITTKYYIHHNLVFKCLN